MGIQWKQGGWTSRAWVHRVGDTAWSDANAQNLEAGFTPLKGYTLVNASMGYRFSKYLRGITLRIEAFNALDNVHYEILPARSVTEPGLSGEVMRRRVTATVGYKF